MGFLGAAWNKYGRANLQGCLDNNVEYSLLTPPSHNGNHNGHDFQSAEEHKFQGESSSTSHTPTTNLARSQGFLQIIRWILSRIALFLPSFLYTPKDKPPRKLHKTSYLDGLRGVAALFVVFHHYSIVFTVSAQKGFHHDQEIAPEGSEPIPIQEDNWILLFPLIRVIHSGRFMVAIFFVISGYVLSYRGLKLAREGKGNKLLDSLGSSVFRRWLRLHLPVIASTFLAFLLTRAGAYTELDPNLYPRAVGMSPVPEKEGTLTQQFWDWYTDTAILCDPFRYGVVWTSKYNINVLWTIPLEWMGSMLVFVTVLGIARTRAWVKVSVLVGLISWCHRDARWEPATFLTGTLLAEISFIKASYLETRGSPYFGEKETLSEGLSAFLYLAPRLGWSLLFILGLYVGSHPQIGAPTTPGYRTLISLIPFPYSSNGTFIGVFWLAIGAVMIVFALENAPFLQRIFTTSIAQYLGDISFSLYMLHGLVEFTLGQWLVPKCMEVTGGWKNGQLGFGGAMLLAGLVLAPITLWVSDVFSRNIDEKCVHFARWVSEKCRDPSTL